MGESLNGGIDWFDTAELYGNGASEHALAQALRANDKRAGDVIVATKWRPMLRTAASIGATIDDRLTCLEGFGINLYQVHLPFSFSSVEAEMDAMAALVRRQKIRTVGVSNFNAGRMKRAHTALDGTGFPGLESDEVQPARPEHRVEGVLAAAKELGITIIAFSPLEQGLLTGKFHEDPVSAEQDLGAASIERAAESGAQPPADRAAEGGGVQPGRDHGAGRARVDDAVPRGSGRRQSPAPRTCARPSRTSLLSVSRSRPTNSGASTRHRGCFCRRGAIRGMSNERRTMR